MENDIKILKRIVKNIEKVILGKKNIIELTLMALLCKGHILIEDIPGVGKTLLASSLAKSIDASFKRIQFTPDILPSDITGFSIYNQKTSDFEFRPGAIMSQLILADEINRTSPKTQSSLLEVMEEFQITVDGNTYHLPQPFMVLATQNPIEYLGTFPLPEAQLDRFFFKVSIGYPEQSDEVMILSRFQKSNPLDSLKPVVNGEEILKIQENIKDVYVDKDLKRYIVDLVNQTRNHNEVQLGSSPRGSICLLRGAQAWAFYNGRNYVIPEDIKKMVIPVLSHRLILKQETKLKKITVEDILYSIIDVVKVPVVTIDEEK
ncbi:MAG: MoxR family ATPase [Clostridiales bacterium]